MSGPLAMHVDAGRCIRCGACSALAPGLFDVGGPVSRLLRAPSEAERSAIAAARLVCPTDAIRAEMSDVDAGEEPFAEDAPLFADLAMGAERVRWSLADVPWSELDTERASPELRSVVREMAFSENATYTATQRFMESFYDDVDFSKWISVWFYEETRHPHVLVEWLKRAGDPVPADFVARSRVATPFMRSLVGTLVTNVISEITAAQAYRRLAARSTEPLLGKLARFIAADEARHAATFFRFARRRLADTPPENAWRERARGVEILQAWLGGAQPATHPVAQMVTRLGEAGATDPIELDFAAVRSRVIRVLGALLDVPLRRQEDVAPALKDLLGQRRATWG